MAPDTIVAPASASGRSGVAVVRISGPNAFEIARRICGPLPEPRRLSLRSFTARDGGLIDRGLVAVFETGGSFTGEAVAELYPHGSDAVVRKLLAEITSGGQARLAEAGEFTRRAFDNGRLDLSQVEALSDLIDAETEAQRTQALSMFGGGLSKPLEEIRSGLLTASALLEATIDFSDEELPGDLEGQVGQSLEKARAALKRMLSGAGAAQKIRDGVTVAILGPPNSGKSSLLNYIAGDDIAIVTDVAGTTRDALSVRLRLGDHLVTLYDTAGLRETEDAIEREGIRRARSIEARADLRIYLSENGAFEMSGASESQDLFLRTKKDVTGHADAISVKTGEGIADMLARLRELVAGLVSGATLISHARQEVLIRSALVETENCSAIFSNGQETDIAAEHLRRAIGLLDEVVGRIGVEDVLGEIFSTFCIGK